jgi:hypothetical protein
MIKSRSRIANRPALEFNFSNRPEGLTERNMCTGELAFRTGCEFSDFCGGNYKGNSLLLFNIVRKVKVKFNQEQTGHEGPERK